MIRRIVLAACAFSGLLFLAGCPVEFPRCETTDDCVVNGELKGVCVNGTCQECGTDSDCQAGFTCERPSVGIGGNRCVPGGCKTNFDCQGGQVCKAGSCQACEADGECGSNATCRAGACVPKAECSVDGDCGGDEICVENKCQSKPKALACEVETVRFGFNEYSLSDSSKASLQQLADCLKTRQPKAQVTIEGHADERGTEEYNMALGDKRATAVKKFLTNLGIGGDRLRTVSYGEERPAQRGSDESSWAANRRAEFIVTNN